MRAVAFLCGAFWGFYMWLTIGTFAGWFTGGGAQRHLLNDWRYEQKLCRDVAIGGYTDLECIDISQRPR